MAILVTVLGDIFSVATLISQQILKAKINQAQCTRLGERVTIVVNAVRDLERLEEGPARRYLVPLQQLNSTLQECLAYVTIYSSKGWVKRHLVADKYERNFSNLYQQLDEDIQALDLSINTAQLFNQVQDKADQARDKAELATKMDSILEANKKTLIEAQRFQMEQKERDRLVLEQLASLRQGLLADKTSPAMPDELATLSIAFHTLQIDSKLTAGLLGDIYGGRRYEQPVSIKAVALTPQGEARVRFVHEVKLLKQLTHPNIVQLMYVSETENHCYLVMESMKRGALADYVASHPLPLKRRHQLAMDILLGLNYLHGQQMGHRRLSPQTILVTQKGTAKLANFSFSKALEQSLLPAPEIGNEGLVYVAPEIVLGKKPASRMTPEDYIRADIYSVGVLLWELLTGQAYFSGLSTPALIEKLNAQVPCPTAYLLPAPYQLLIQDCLDYVPLKRPSAGRIIQRLTEAKAVLLEQMETAGTFYAAGLKKEQEKDLGGAKSNYQIAAYYGSMRALTNLGVFYAQGIGGLPLAPEKAHRYFKEAATMGHVRAMENLALLYKKGEGVAQKSAKAKFWYQRAQEEGSKTAARALQEYQAINMAK